MRLSSLESARTTGDSNRSCPFLADRMALDMREARNYRVGLPWDDLSACDNSILPMVVAILTPSSSYAMRWLLVEPRLYFLLEAGKDSPVLRAFDMLAPPYGSPAASF